jgi:hypothetical protein
MDFDVIAFSTYLWNIKIVEKLVKEIKNSKRIMVVAGGPEVGNDPDYYMRTIPFDFIIAGEGEIAFEELMKALDKKLLFSSVSNLVFRDSGKILRNIVKPIMDLDTLQNPYHSEDDLPHLPNKIQYVEISRGCPFHCSYCLASLDNKVRFFSLDRVKNDLLYLMENGGKTFKFLDRTFNLKPAAAMEIFQFIIENHAPGTVFQFEITGDMLPKEIIEYLNSHAPKNLFRFEIGIQSTNVSTNLAVDRHQNNAILFENIRLIQAGGVIDLHLDLIAGLPGEDLSSFENTFNEVFALRPKELQLGFLKMLRGTKIRNEAKLYGYVYKQLPPYEITQNDSLSVRDLEIIHLVEETLDLFWNKGFLTKAMTFLLSTIGSPFRFFHEVGFYMIESNHSFHGYQYSDLFEWLLSFVQRTYPSLADSAFDLFKLEYLSNSKTKPKIWWDNEEVSKRKNAIIRDFFKIDNSIPIDDLYKYAVVTAYQNGYLLAVYHPKNREIKIFK